MPSEHASPSAGWREVYDAMGTETDGDPDLRADGCGERSEPQAGSGNDRGCGERSEPQAGSGNDRDHDGRPRPEPCPDCGAIPGVDGGDVCCAGRAVVVRDSRDPDG